MSEPTAAPPSHPPASHERATFAAGCFWGVEDAFRHVPGVVATRVGYTGGETENPTYEQVCAHGTGHAEAVEVIFNPGEVSYEELVEFFWRIHDPTQVNRQGPDVGDQYRTAIFAHDERQAKIAQASKETLEESRVLPVAVATEITPVGVFWEAEDYHQQYFEKRGMAGCHLPDGYFPNA